MTCVVEGCKREPRVRQLCNRHYLRLRRHGSVHAGRDRNSTPPEACTVNGCDLPHEAKGFCSTHYRRWRRTGVPTGVIERHATAAARFEAYHEVQADGCWVWTGAKTPAGYGALRSDDGATIYAHRYAFEIHHGRPVADGMHLHHVCRLRPCVNPEHLTEMDPGEHTQLHLAERWASEDPEPCEARS